MHHCRSFCAGHSLKLLTCLQYGRGSPLRLERPRDRQGTARSCHELNGVGDYRRSDLQIVSPEDRHWGTQEHSAIVATSPHGGRKFSELLIGDREGRK